MLPVYLNTYGRLGTPPDPGSNVERDETIAQSKDLRRAVDYLETRFPYDQIDFVPIRSIVKRQHRNARPTRR